MDVVDKATRSKMMSGIRSKNTKPEVLLRSELHARGYRFRLHRRDLPGSPDIVLPKYSAVIEVHGCFWHRHPGCRFASTPKTREDFWQAKFEANVQRDASNIVELGRLGWRTFVAWECDIKRNVEEVADRIEEWLPSY